MPALWKISVDVGMPSTRVKSSWGLVLVSIFTVGVEPSGIKGGKVISMGVLCPMRTFWG